MNASAVCDWIRAYLATKLGVSTEAINPSERFRRLGVDSLTATSMLAALGTELGRPLSPTLAWQFPTPIDLARHLAGEAGPAEIPTERRHRTDDEPVAIVGLSCRFPAAPDKEAFWRLLRDGVDAIREVPRDRWDLDALYDSNVAAPGKMSTRFGGFLDDVASFDASFFGISPREAAEMDPQQRLMLELSWEAIEDSGVPPAQLKDTRTGVFFGAMWMDYTHLPGATADRIAPHTATGQDLSIVPARVSYTLGLLGPSLAVNTACSSSLVALHLARHSLLRGESSLALAGGVNLILSPDSTIAMSKFGAMAPDGRSKAFDARANGYVRGEGGGVVVLKRLSDALADGDHVYCVIRGSALNNDGFSNGLTAPSPRAQEAVIRDACADAGIAPAEVQYVEAHGTGTMLGDPIEAGALGAALGTGRAPDRPLRIGSVKTNFGHLEAAAGVAGLIKVALSMAHRELPASLHFQRPNPHIPFESLRMRVQAKREPWEAEAGRRIAGVSSFGFGGTNAHVVLESTDAPRSVRLAAASTEKLSDEARKLVEAMRASPAAFDAIPDAGDAAHRLAVTVASDRELTDHLEGFLAGRPQPGLVVGVATTPPPRVVLVFGGQGSQWLGMGRALQRGEPVARAVIERCDRAIHDLVGWSLLERLRSDDASQIDRTDFVQPALFAMQVALARAMQARGLRVDAVVGQSMGEVAAAHVSGALSLADAVRIMCVRSQVVGQAKGGRMLVAGLSLGAATDAIAPYKDRLSVAVAAGPESTVVAGAEEAVAALHTDLEARGIAARIVRVDYASHSHYMDPVLPELRRRLESTRPRGGEIAFWSTVTGGPLDGASLDAEYWTRNLREPVLFAPTVERLAAQGPTVFVEVDPHPVLAVFVEQCLAHAGGVGAVVGCAARDEPETLTLREAAARLFVAGCAVRAEPSPPPEGAHEVFVLSAKTPDALRASAAALREHLIAHPGLSLSGLARALLSMRSSDGHRLALTASNREGLLRALEASSRGERSPGTSAGQESSRPGKLAWLFTGQGAQLVGMGRGLYNEWPAFREALDTAFASVDRHLDRPLRDVMWAAPGSAEAALLDQTGYTQPALFAVEWALAALWRSWGVGPELVAGHSIGEITAACVAGVFSLADAARLVCARGRLMQALPAGGAMVSIDAPEAEVAAAVAPYAATVSVAAINGPSSVVIAGLEATVLGVVEGLSSRKRRSKRLVVSHAFHSPLMDPMLDEFRRVAESVAYGPATIPLVSNVSGRLAGAEVSTAGYWVRHVREAVRFADGVKALEAAGARAYVEIGPRATLLGLASEILPGGAVLVPSLQPGRVESETMLEALGALYVHGQSIDPKRLFPEGAPRVELPLMAWQRERYWRESPTDETGLVAHEGAAETARGEDDRLLSIEWESSPLPAPRAARGRWLLIGERSGYAKALGASLEAAGQAVVLAAGDATMDGARAMLGGAFGGDPPTAIVHLRSLEGGSEPDPIEAAIVRGYDSVLGVVQAIAAMGWRDAPRLWIVTRGAQAVQGGDVNVAQSTLLGLARVVAMEHPELRCCRIDLDRVPAAGEADELRGELLADDGEDEIAWRQGQRWVARLARAGTGPATDVAAPSGSRIRSDGSYLITGGLGGLGLSLAQWLAERGAGHVVLAGRSGVTTEAQRDAVALIEKRGTSVTIAKVDVADRTSLAAVLTALPGSRPLRGVFHAAGVVDDGLLAGQTPARFRRVMAPKVQGAWNLHTLTRDAQLDLFVMYSSAVGLLGLPGQGNYAAANTFLDALAHHRRAQGLPAVSIDWGAFADVGLAAAQANRGQRMEGRGMRSLKPEEGLAALEQVLAQGAPQLAVLSIDVQQWLEFFPAAAANRMLARLLEDQALAARPAGDSAVLARLAAASPEVRLRMVEELVREQVALVLRIPSDKIPRLEPLASIGMDSLMGLELRNRLEVVLGVRLPAGALWTYPTLAVLSQHLAADKNDGEAGAVETSSAAAPVADDRLKKEVADMESGDLLSLMDTLLDRANQGPK